MSKVNDIGYLSLIVLFFLSPSFKGEICVYNVCWRFFKSSFIKIETLL